MVNETQNYWNTYEYSKLKLLLHHEKVNSVMSVLKGDSLLDRLYPLSIELHLTDYCNLNCEWCTDKNLHYNPSELDFDIACKLVTDFAKNNTGITIEGGGEPTIYKGFSDIIDIGNKKNASMGLITNGIVDIANELNKFKWVRISLDASTPEEYKREKGIDKFEVVMENLSRYNTFRDIKHTFMGIGYILTNRNYENIENLVDRLDKLGVDYLYFRPVEECNELLPTKSQLFDLNKKLQDLTDKRRIKYLLIINERYEEANANLPCIAHSLTSIIHANGDVVCCEKRRSDIRILGNVKKSTFEEIWKSSYRKEVTKHLLAPENQKSCSVCRMTEFNRIFYSMANINTDKFI